MENVKAVFNPQWNGEDGYLVNYDDTINAVREGVAFYTNQMCIMELCWFIPTYDVYVVNKYGKEIKIVNDGSLTNKDLKSSTNIFKLWRAGGFDLSKSKTKYVCPDCGSDISVWVDLDASCTFNVNEGELSEPTIDNTFQSDGRAGIHCTECEWEFDVYEANDNDNAFKLLLDEAIVKQASIKQLTIKRD